MLDEWIENICNLPNDKASGPSSISYEMLKYLNRNNQSSILHAFICVCIDLGEIPDVWKKVTVYLIPKPKPFFTSLTNTRNQFAALPSNSTFEPLRIINKIIQDANKSNNELWLLSQDLGKAYDRVNIFMLEKAMIHLKIPSSFIRIISSLFKNHTNQVITAYSPIDSYEALIGID
ncbi:uncharacterized protein LOC104089907 [Rhizophagus clarus]|uniref:Uncharacterized protein LOC104089907 n=1 Tax=Rhizophagus clarus TaxID=94130 RepID=A0A8H3QZ70_9GLOM|nr:uncharacterized protein LOC104089907 [Rhizophagus clarus]